MCYRNLAESESIFKKISSEVVSLTFELGTRVQLKETIKEFASAGIINFIYNERIPAEDTLFCCLLQYK